MTELEDWLREVQTGRCVACHQGVNVGGNLFQKFGLMGVLLADDNALNQKLARRMLEMMGYHVTSAADGAAALARSRARDPGCST